MQINEFKNIIYVLRKEAGMSQTDMAKCFSIGQSAIGMWETGKRMPSREKMEEIADHFNVDLDYLYGRQYERRRIDLSSPELDAEIVGNAEFKAMYDNYKKLTAEQKEMIRSIMNAFVVVNQ